jgi:F-type H+-transporting ATPase subunit b
MAGARTDASSIRAEARTAGRQVIDEKRAEASGEVAETVQQADEQLSQQGSAAQSELESSVDGLSATLASRILGVDVGGPPKNVSR